MIARLVALVICLATACISALGGTASTRASTTTQAADAKVFDFPLERGQYVFIGKETGSKGKDRWSTGTEPVWTFLIEPDSALEKWTMRISVAPARDNNDTSAWEATVSQRNSDGSMQERLGVKWQTPRPKETDAEQKLYREDTPPANEVQLHRIVYAKVDGEVHDVLIAVASKPDSFSHVITIPKKYFIFKWSDCWMKVK